MTARHKKCRFRDHSDCDGYADHPSRANGHVRECGYCLCDGLLWFEKTTIATLRIGDCFKRAHFAGLQGPSGKIVVADWANGALSFPAPSNCFETAGDHN